MAFQSIEQFAPLASPFDVISVTKKSEEIFAALSTNSPAKVKEEACSEKKGGGKKLIDKSWSDQEVLEIKAGEKLYPKNTYTERKRGEMILSVSPSCLEKGRSVGAVNRKLSKLKENSEKEKSRQAAEVRRTSANLQKESAKQETPKKSSKRMTRATKKKASKVTGDNDRVEMNTAFRWGGDGMFTNIEETTSDDEEVGWESGDKLDERSEKAAKLLVSQISYKVVTPEPPSFLFTGPRSLPEENSFVNLNQFYESDVSTLSPSPDEIHPKILSPPEEEKYGEDIQAFFYFLQEVSQKRKRETWE